MPELTPTSVAERYDITFFGVTRSHNTSQRGAAIQTFSSKRLTLDDTSVNCVYSNGTLRYSVFLYLFLKGGLNRRSHRPNRFARAAPQSELISVYPKQAICQRSHINVGLDTKRGGFAALPAVACAERQSLTSFLSDFVLFLEEDYRRHWPVSHQLPHIHGAADLSAKKFPLVQGAGDSRDLCTWLAAGNSFICISQCKCTACFKHDSSYLDT